MQFWKRKRRVSQQGTTASDTGQVRKAKRTIKRSPPVAMEVKLLAIEALEAGRYGARGDPARGTVQDRGGWKLWTR